MGARSLRRVLGFASAETTASEGAEVVRPPG